MPDVDAKELVLEIFPAAMLDVLAGQRMIDREEPLDFGRLLLGASLRETLQTFLHQVRPDMPPEMAEEIVTAAILVVIRRVAEMAIAAGAQGKQPLLTIDRDRA
jgi:hypothetical protein